MANFTTLSFGKEFCEWLRTYKNYSDSTIESRLNNVTKIEQAYGPLPELWKKDNFEALLKELTYTQKDRSNRKPNTCKIPINGDFYNGLATYRSALRLYSAFLMSLPPEQAGLPFGEIGNRTYASLLALDKQVKKKDNYTTRDVDNLIISPLKLLLENGLGGLGYEFHTEFQADHTDNSRNRYDLIGVPDSCDKPVIVVEADTHRADQMSKKVVSRIALNSENPLLYVSLIYSNDHANNNAEKKECEKYIGYVRELFSIFTQPQKSFLPFRLYKV